MSPQDSPGLRWICWPDPDRVCIEGGCGYCTPGPLEPRAEVRRNHRQLTRVQIEDYAASNGYVIEDHDITGGMRQRAVRS